MSLRTSFIVTLVSKNKKNYRKGTGITLSFLALLFGCIVSSPIIGADEQTCISFLQEDDFSYVDGDTSEWSHDDTFVNLGTNHWNLMDGTANVYGYENGGEAILTHRGTRGLGILSNENDEIDSIQGMEHIDITFDTPQLLKMFEVRSLFNDEGPGGAPERGDVKLFLNGLDVEYYQIVGEESSSGGNDGDITIVIYQEILFDKIVFYVEPSANYNGWSDFSVAKVCIVANNQPYIPIDPNPMDGKTEVDIHTDVTWNGGDPDGDPVTYDVYFGTSSPPPLTVHNTTDTSYAPDTMEYDTTYFWKIKAWDNNGASTVGPVWKFTTEEKPNSPPIVSNIPDQTIPEGSTFTEIYLDDFVADVEDTDENIEWTYTGNTHLTITITDHITTITTPTPDWFGSEIITFTATDTGGLTDSDSAVFTVNSVNDPPNKPYTPSPNNAKTDITLNPKLSVYVLDPDGNTMDVHFYNAVNGKLIGLDTDVESGGIASVTWPNLDYYTVYRWYAVANDSEFNNQSDTWKFTTKGEIIPITNTPSNNPPVADASASETFGFINEIINFDGTLSEDNDGVITSYLWNFDDGATGYGDITTNVYSAVGTYHVTLIVTDDDGATDSDTIDVVISKANNPPSTPTIEGPTTGHKNTDYEFTALSFDADNDTIQYLFDWGDGETIATEFLQNGTPAHQTHRWGHYGEYTITVKAFDSDTESGVTDYTILIDVLPIDDQIKGYLINEDSEYAYDSFDNTDTGEQIDVEKENYNTTYLIDSDGDGKWDYAYNITSGLTTYYDYLYHKYYQKLSQDTPGFEGIYMLAMILAVSMILKRKKKKNSQQ